MRSIFFTTLFTGLCAVAASAQPFISFAGPVNLPDSLIIPSEMINFDEYKDWAAGSATFPKSLAYDQHTLPDEYEYNGTTRRFQWERMGAFLQRIDRINASDGNWAVLENYKNEHERPPLAEDYEYDDHNMVTDSYGVMRNQSVPVYEPQDLSQPERYGRDGSLVEIVGEDDGYYRVVNTNYAGEWYIPDEYVRRLDNKRFDHVVFVDRTNQNICVMENAGGEWVVRSMNPATTGLHRPPYQYETPAGIFVLQDKKPKMFYYRDGTTDIAGYAPHANRFTNGAYIHGVPVNNPNGSTVEFSNTLGTTPRSHMCVRTATSHAKYIYDNLPADESLIVVID